MSIKKILVGALTALGIGTAVANTNLPNNYDSSSYQINISQSDWRKSREILNSLENRNILTYYNAYENLAMNSKSSLKNVQEFENKMVRGTLYGLLAQATDEGILSESDFNLLERQIKFFDEEINKRFYLKRET